MKTNLTPALAVLASLFLALTSGAPTPSPGPVPDDTQPDNTVSNHHADEGGVNDCTRTTLENQTTAASPLVYDCWHLYNNIQGDGEWTVISGQHTIATYGTCAFGVTADGPAHIGNQDIREAVRGAITAFGGPGNRGRIGAKGKFQCQKQIADSSRDLRNVEWGIYHT